MLFGDRLDEALLLDVDPHIRTVCRSNGSEGECSVFNGTVMLPFLLRRWLAAIRLVDDTLLATDGPPELIGVLGGCGGGSSDAHALTSATVGEGFGDFIAD